MMCEVERCSECGSTHIIDDNEQGEAVCVNCGLVLGHTEFTPPSDRITKNVPNHIIAYTSFALGTETPSSQRTELNVAYDIDRLIQKIDLPHNMKQLAITYVRKLLSAMRRKNSHKIRFTRNELAVVSIWVTIKRLNYPLTADAYLRKLRPLIKVPNLMKLEKRANYFIKNENRIPNIALVTGHITKIAAQLESAHILDNVYASNVSSYAIQMVYANPSIVTHRRANLVAASAIFAADSLLTKRLLLKTLAKIANAGIGNISTIAETCKRYAPPLPPECAAIKFSYYLQKEIGLC